MTSAAEALDRQPTLIGPTLRLRPLGADEFEALHAVASDPPIWEQHPESTRWRRDVFERFFAGAMASGGALAILDRASDAMIGSSRYVITAEGDLEIGWTFLARSRWGGPTNAEAKQLMLDHAFAVVGSVIFNIGAGNWRSRRAVEKLGATLEAETMAPHGPGVRYRLTREAFAARPQRASV